MNQLARPNVNSTSVKSFRVSCVTSYGISNFRQDSMRWSSMKSEATTSLANNLRYRSALPEGPGIELYEVKPKHTAVKMEEVVTRWVDDGFCRLDQILILSPHGTKAKTALAGHSNIGEWPLVGFGGTKRGTGQITGKMRERGGQRKSVKLGTVKDSPFLNTNTQRSILDSLDATPMDPLLARIREPRRKANESCAVKSRSVHMSL